MKFGLLTLFDHYAEDCSEEQYYKNLSATESAACFYRFTVDRTSGRSELLPKVVDLMRA
jgi:hypothetical protein